MTDVKLYLGDCLEVMKSAKKRDGHNDKDRKRLIINDNQ